MKKKFTILMVLALTFASATFAQGNFGREIRRERIERFNHFRNTRFDQREWRRDYFHHRNCL